MNWDQDIQELEEYFNNITIPTIAIKLDSCTDINDCNKFIHSHLTVIKSNNGNMSFLPYLERLLLLRTILINNRGI
jgi:hypothetical protein